MGAERPVQIGPAFFPAQANLMAGGVRPPQEKRREGRAQKAGQGTGEFLALVETAFAQAIRMQRHGNHGVGHGQIRARLCKQPPDKVQDSQIAPEFAAKEQGSERSGIGRVKPEMPPGRRRGQAIPARRGTYRNGKRLAATGAGALIPRLQQGAADRAKGGVRRRLGRIHAPAESATPLVKRSGGQQAAQDLKD